MKTDSETVTLRCVTKKTGTTGVVEILNRYAQEYARRWFHGDPATGTPPRQLKELAKQCNLTGSQATGVKDGTYRLGVPAVDKFAHGIGKTFLEFVRDAYAFHEGKAPFVMSNPNRARAEAAFVRLGNAEESVRVWADSVYAGLSPNDDRNPEWVLKALMLEKERDPDATGKPRPAEWPGWVLARNEFLLDDRLGELAPALIGYGETPTSDHRPDPLNAKTLAPLVTKFRDAHPEDTERWASEYEAWAVKADSLLDELQKTHRAAKRPRKPTEPPSSPRPKSSEEDATGKRHPPKNKNRTKS